MVLDPFKLCVPQYIIQSTGVPLGVLVSKSESFKLYSLLFKLSIKIDDSLKIFKSLQKIAFITDEHKSFDKHESVYGLKINKCYNHLNRTIEYSLALDLLLRGILYSCSEEEFSKKLWMECIYDGAYI